MRSAGVSGRQCQQAAFPKGEGEGLWARQDSLGDSWNYPPWTVPSLPQPCGSPWQAAQCSCGGKKLLQLHLEVWKEFTARVKTRLQLPNKTEACKAAEASERLLVCAGRVLQQHLSQ